MTDVDVDPDNLRQAKLNIGNSTQETDAALTSFVNELNGFGEPWGNDDLGSLIGLSYQGIFAAAMDCFASNLDVVDDYAELLGSAADELQRTDQASAQLSQQAQANLPNLPL